MILIKANEAQFGESNCVWYSVSQRFLGQKVGSFFVVSEECPRGLVAERLIDARKRVRTIIGRAQRKHAKARLR